MSTKEALPYLPIPPEILIGKPDSFAVIHPQGGIVETLVLGGIPVFWSGLRPDKKPAASHLCFPWFGPYKGPLLDGIANPGNHGPARKEQWQIYDRQHNSRADLILGIPNVTSTYPNLHAFLSHLLLSDQRAFFRLLTADNRSDQPQPLVQPGFHDYWRISADQAPNIVINGQTYPLEQWLQATLIPIQPANSIRIPNMGEFLLRQQGFTHLVLWTQEGAPFCCIEPAHDPNKLQEAPPIPPHQFKHWWTMIQKID